MPALHIPSMPQDLYNYIQKLAFAQKCSLDAQVIVLLSQFQKQEEKREQQARILADISQSRMTLPNTVPDSVTLLTDVTHSCSQTIVAKRRRSTPKNSIVFWSASRPLCDL